MPGGLRFPRGPSLGRSCRNPALRARMPAGLYARAWRMHFMPIPEDILAYNAAQSPVDRRICDALAGAIDRQLSGRKSAGAAPRGVERKIWHRHPVWFIDGNPIVGYSKLKDSIRLLFWSGQSFDEPGLAPEGSFKAAEARYTSEDQISAKDLKRWLAKSIEIQWDYKNIVKRKGKLVRLKGPE